MARINLQIQAAKVVKVLSSINEIFSQLVWPVHYKTHTGCGASYKIPTKVICHNSKAWKTGKVQTRFRDCCGSNQEKESDLVT